MKIVANNFLLIEDPGSLILGVDVAGDATEVGGTQLSMYVPIHAAGGALRIITAEHTFQYSIVADQNEIQQLYTLRMESTGLVSRITTSDASADGSVDPGLDSLALSNQRLNDYDLWLTSQEVRVIVPGGETVDRLDLVQTFDQFEVTALQNSNELVILTTPNPNINLTDVELVQFRIVTNGAEYLTQELTITPGDPALSECRVAGTLFEGDPVMNEAAYRNTTMSITLTLRFETWIADEAALRLGIIEMMEVSTSAAATSHFFEGQRPEPVNPRGLAQLIEEASIVRASEQSVVVTLGRSMEIRHPENLSILSIPAGITRSGRSDIPVIVPFERTILPSTGTLTVLTTNGDVISEKDFWVGSTRITLELSEDEWQDVSLLTDFARVSFETHIRASLTSSSPEWTALIQNAQVTFSTEGGSLHLDIAQQSSAVFNITTVVEVQADVPLETADGLPTRLSNTALSNTSFFLITPVQSFVSIGRAVVRESDLWNEQVVISFALLDDQFVGTAEQLLSVMRSTFDAKFPLNQISASMELQELTLSSFNLVFPQAQPDTFNISADRTLSFTFPGDLLRNGNELSSPEILFAATAVVSTMTGTASRNKQHVVQGFTFQIALQNDTWLPGVTTPISMHARQETPHGWHTVFANLSFHILDGVSLVVTVPPSPAYDISTIEVIDVFVNENATYNHKRAYVGNFTIQGSTAIEREHHSYNKLTQELLAEASTLKKIIMNIKSSLTFSSESSDNTTEGFGPLDTLYGRMRKLNSSGIDHPITICKPPLLNGAESTIVQSALTNVINALSTYKTTHAFPSERLCVPTLVPKIEPGQPTRVHTLLLSRAMKVDMQLNDDQLTTLPEAQVHALTLSATDTVTFSGDSILTATFAA